MIGLDRPSVTLSGRRVVSGPGRPGGPHRRRYLPGLDALETREVLSTLVVMNTNASGPGSLRQLVQNAANGDVVTFDPGLNGKTIKSNSGSIAVLKNVQILGPGKDLLTLDASYGQMFRVLSGATNVTIAGLTIKGGVDEVEGGAIRDWGGNNSTLVLRDDAFIGNKVFGDNARGGAVAKEKGTLRIEGCVFRENTVESLPGHGDASGAAVFAQGRLVVIDSTFEDGQVRAGTLPSQLFTTRGGTGRGGAIAYSAAKGAVADLEGRPVNPEGRSLAGVFISGSTFRSNLIYAGYGAALPKTPTDGGDAFGGAVSIEANDVDGLTVQVLTSQFRDNEANAGQAGEGLGNDLPANGGNAYGGGVWVNAGTSAGLSLLVDQQSGFFGNIAAGGNGRSMPKMNDPSLFHSRRAGDGHGGGIAIEAAESTLATFSIKNSLFASDAEGGRGGWIGQNSTDVWGGDGGNGYGGGVWIDAGASTDSTFSVVGDTFIACGAWGEFGGSATLELGFGGTGGDGIGGALDFPGGGSLRAKLTIADSRFRNVKAGGGDGGHAGTRMPSDFLHGANSGGQGGSAYGGAIAVDFGGSREANAFLLHNLISKSEARGWWGGEGGPSLDHYNGKGGDGGNAFGGAIYVDAGTSAKPGFNVLGGTITMATAYGGHGGRGGDTPGARGSFGGSGGNGGWGGDAFGGGIYLGGVSRGSLNSTWSLIDLAINACVANSAYGADGGDGFSGGDGGDSGRAQGGGVFTEFGGKVRILRSSILDNDVIRGLGGQGGKGFIGALDGKKGKATNVYGPGMAVGQSSGVVEVVDTVIESKKSKINLYVFDPMNRVVYS